MWGERASSRLFLSFFLFLSDSDESRLSLFYEQKEPDEEPDESRLGLFYEQKGIKTQSEIADGAVSSFMVNQMTLNDRIMVI